MTAGVTETFTEKAELLKDVLTEREASIVNYHDQQSMLKFGRRTVELTHSIERTSVQVDTISCLLPHSKILLNGFHLAKLRLLHGAEMLILQGMPKDLIVEVAQAYGSSFLSDLAGNAFSGACLTVCLIVALSVPAFK